MVGLERINGFSVLPVEPPEYVEPRPHAGWPHEGKIDVKKILSSVTMYVGVLFGHPNPSFL